MALIKSTLYIEVGSYVAIVDVDYNPLSVSAIKHIDFEPELKAEDITYTCETMITEGNTIASSKTILYYYNHCKIQDEPLAVLIDKEL